jgi:hypothetical protein
VSLAIGVVVPDSADGDQPTLGCLQFCRLCGRRVETFLTGLVATREA